MSDIVTLYSTRGIIMSDNVTLYSTNGDDYAYEDEEDILERLIDDMGEGVGHPYYSAEFTKVKASQLVMVSRMLEELDDRLYDIANNEDTTPFIDVNKEAKYELEEFMINWINKHIKLGDYYEFNGNPRTLHITQEQYQYWNN